MSASDDDRSRFSRNAFLALTVNAAHQRNHVFAADVGFGHEKRRSLQRALRSTLREIEPEYTQGGVPDAAHEANIVGLADGLTLQFCDTLAGGRYRVGTAQKALNLYLKYAWCADWIAEPPHCPFDNIILRVLPLPASLRRWTVMDDIEGYRRWVAVAREASGGSSLAAWELKKYAAAFA